MGKNKNKGKQSNSNTHSPSKGKEKEQDKEEKKLLKYESKQAKSILALITTSTSLYITLIFIGIITTSVPAWLILYSLSSSLSSVASPQQQTLDRSIVALSYGPLLLV